MPNLREVRVLVIGLGNELRGDDGAGLEAARRLRRPAAALGVEVREHQGDPTELLDVWKPADGVLLVDAMRSHLPAGTIRRFDASHEPLTGHLRGTASTHALGLADAIELGRALDRVPARVLVYAVAGRAFTAGTGLSREITAAIPALATALLAESIRLIDGHGQAPPEAA